MAQAQVRVGCAEIPAGVLRKRYLSQLNFIERSATFYEPPKTSVARKWRRDVPDNFGIAVVAWQAITHPPAEGSYRRMNRTLTTDQLSQAGSYRDTAFVRQAVSQLADVAAAAQAEVALFRTHVGFAPSAANRDTLKRFFGEIAPETLFPDAVRAWEPAGLWEPDVAAAFAQDLGVAMAIDPFQRDPLAPNPVPLTPQAYLRVSGLGVNRRRLSAEQLLDLAERINECESSWTVFAHEEAFRDATALHKLLTGSDER